MKLSPAEHTEAEQAAPTAASPPEPHHNRRQPIPAWAPVFAVLFLISLALRVIWLDLPKDALIFDEAYYVNASRIILGIPPARGAAYVGSPPGVDPNTEHPPLGKVLMAASIHFLGDTALAWRLPSIIAGMASIVLVLAIVRALGGDGWLGVLAAGLFAFDNLAFVHARIGTLDMMLVAFELLAVWLFLRGRGLLSALLAGLAFALASLVKISGAYGLSALLLYALLQAIVDWRRSGRWPIAPAWRAAALVLVFLPAWFAGLWLLDLRFSTYRSPVAHLQHMVSFGLALSRQRGPANTESDPWQWLINEVQIPYLRVDEQIRSGDQVLETRPTIYFRGAMNPIIIGIAPLALSYVAWRAWRKRDPLSLWVVAWVGATYLPFVVTATFVHRISYIFYFLPTLPAVTVAIAQLLRQSGLPRPASWGYLVMVLVGFAGYFPFRRWPQ